MEGEYAAMERCFTCSPNELKSLSSDADWRVRFAAVVAMGVRKSPSFLPELERILEIEDARPLFSQPPAIFIGTTGDTRLAEQVKPFQVTFQHPVDEATKEAWKTRGRVIQAALFAIYEIGEITESLLVRIHHYVEDEGQDTSVRAAAARALGKVGDSRSLSYCERAAEYDEWCTKVEAQKSIVLLKRA